MGGRGDRSHLGRRGDAAITEAGLSDHAGRYLWGVPGAVSTLRSVLAHLFDGTPAATKSTRTCAA